MINYFDQNSVESIANARRQQLLDEAESYRREREIRAARRKSAGSGSGPVRQAIGFGLIRAGERISGSREPIPAA